MANYGYSTAGCADCAVTFVDEDGVAINADTDEDAVYAAWKEHTCTGGVPAWRSPTVTIANSHASN
jgi:hypothetical protein